MKRKPTLKSMIAITWLLALSILGTWLVSMICLTVVTAQEIYDRLYAESYDFPNRVDSLGMFSEFYDKSFSQYGYQYERPDYLEYQMLRAISMNTSHTLWSYGHYGNSTSGHDKLIRDVSYPVETAILFYDGAGNLIHNSGDDVIFFDYYTREEWDTGMDTTAGLHYGWIDISEGKNAESWEDDPYLRFRTTYAGTHSLWGIGAIRVTGYFEGTELKPVVMHYVSDAQIRQIVESTDQFSTGENSWSYIVSDVDRTGQLEWQLQFDRSGEYVESDLVIVYITHPNMWDDQAAALTYEEETYESLAALMETLDFPSWADIYQSFYHGDLYSMGKYGLTELLVFTGWNYADYNNFYENYDGEPGEEEPAIDFTLITAVRSNPLACAISALRNIYIVTGLLVLVMFLLVRSGIKKHLVQPVADIVDAMDDGWKNIYHPENAPTMWHEAEKLHVGFASEQDRRRMKDNEITRLKTALEYAKTAEQNRRQMTSNIAHELKTPLAVIHSYAEGLKEHIAEDKRDKYIDVILSEAERTDRMVLEMLDLSRLEAGKVKLSRDDVSLITLTRSIFEKLEMAAQAKNLQVDFLFPEDFTITADESRIAQVIENFATNAIKYTPVGGRIAVRIQKGRTGTSFSIKNESTPLSNEALNKVWDTFYRTDESRSGGGTGLGLAIAKSIIELHGGKCSVRNTKLGVEFSFTV